MNIAGSIAQVPLTGSFGRDRDTKFVALMLGANLVLDCPAPVRAPDRPPPSAVTISEYSGGCSSLKNQE